MKIDHPSEWPLLSIITPSYNHAKYLRETIECVLAQDYPYLEHVIVDGGSQDGTIELLKEYSARFPGRIRWISEPDNGQSDALNKGVMLAHGEIIGWQNSDDFYLPHSIAKPVCYLARNPSLAAVYGACEWVDAAGRHIGEFPAGPFDFARLLEFCTIPNQAAFVRKEALLASGGIDTSLHFAMDYDLWLRLGVTQQIEYVPVTCGAWRFHEAAKSHSGMLKHRLECIAVVDRIFAHTALPERYKALRSSVLQRHIFNALLVALAAHDDDLAEQLFERLRETDLELSRWRYFTGEILARRFITSQWFGFPEPPRIERVPRRVLDLLQSHALVPSIVSRQMIACRHVFQARSEPGSNHACVSMHQVRHLIRAWQADPMLLIDPAPKVVAQVLYYNNRVPFMMEAVRVLWRGKLAIQRMGSRISRARL